VAPTSLLCFCASDFADLAAAASAFSSLASASASFALAALEASTYSFDISTDGASGAGIVFGAYGALLTTG